MVNSEPEITWRAVLDANILLQAPIRDTLLRLAEVDLLAVLWSEAILDEVARNFASVTGPINAEQRYRRLRAALDRSFPFALVTGYEYLTETLPTALHDRHVLACAIHAQANALITYNTRHFPQRHATPYRVRIWHPDAFLLEVLRYRPTMVAKVIADQGATMHPPRTTDQVLTRLAQDVPRFAAEAQRLFGR